MPKSLSILRLLFALAVMSGLSLAQTVLMPIPRQCFPDSLSSGKPLAGGKIFTYQAGTSIQQATFTDATGLVQNTNPIVLDAAGCASIWLTSGQAYRFVAQNAFGVQEWTADQVSGLTTAGSSVSQALTTVSFTATPTFTALGQFQVFKMTLTGNVTSSTLSMTGITTPSLISFELTQDGTGGRTFAWPLNVAGQVTPINPVANSVTTESFFWDGTTAWSVNNALPSGNNAFSGTNTFSGGTTFSGALTGTGTNSFTNINSTQMCDQFAGATADVKVNACIAALPSTGGTADARGLIGAQTVAAEIDVGGPAGTPTKFVNLLLPCGAVWNVTISNGTSSALKVFGGSSIVSTMCAQNSSFQLKLAAAGNVASLVTNDQTCAACSFKLHGMMLYNTLLGTVANAMMDLSNLGNNAEVSSINIATFKTKGLWIHATNSESTFTAVNVDGNQTAGAIPCTIETTSTSLETMRFYALDCQHPGAGNNLLVINGHGASNLNNITFVGSHFEGSNTDTTTPFVSVADAKNIAFYSPLFNSLDSGTTNWGVNISQTASNLTDGITVVNATHGNGNLINDTIRTKTVSGNGVLPFYSYSAANSNNAFLIANGTVFTEGTNPAYSNLAGADVCYSDSTAHLIKCNYNNSAGYHGLRLTETGSCTMSSGTCTVTWATAFTSQPVCIASWNGTGTLTGSVQAVPSATNCVVTSSINTNTAVMQVLGVGNPN